MCLLITIAFTALFFVLMKLDHENKYSVRPVFITFLSASIMWVVDGIWRVIGGEPFWDFGEGEAALGGPQSSDTINTLQRRLCRRPDPASPASRPDEP